MMNKFAVVAGIVCLSGVSGCDNTYTPSAHHQEAASTGSLLSGTDTGLSTNGMNDGSIKSNAGSASGEGGGH